MKKKLPLIILLLILVLAAGLGIFHYFYTKTRFNDTYVNGNTAGNLYNSGLFCESQGSIFFSNPSDGGKLYSMDSDGTNLKKMCDDVAAFINADSNYVYYVRSNTVDGSPFSFLNINTDSLCRINRTGGDTILVLDSAPSLYASLAGNYIYYLRYDKTDATSLYKVKIDGTEQKQIDKNPYYTCAAEGQYIYYNGLERDHNVWRINTASDSKEQVYEANTWMPVITDSSVVYFMDCDNNYKLARANMTGGEKSILCDDRIDCYNLYGSYIYFQRNDADAPALCRMRTDGSDYTVIAEGNYKDINVTSRYIYFKDFQSGMMYCTPTDSAGSVALYNPGTGE